MVRVPTNPPTVGSDAELAQVPGPAGQPPMDESMLARLNRHGFRLVMVADVIALLTIAIGSMIVRFGFAWPQYPVPLYLVSFATSTLIMVASFYFGGLYEREPRLGAPPALPKAGALTLGAGGLIALLTLALSGVARIVGWSAERALPFPVINLVVLIVLGAVAVASNRWLVQRVRSRREGPPRVLLVGSADELTIATGHLSAISDRVDIRGRLEDPSMLLDEVDEADATDVMLLSRRSLDPLYPDGFEQLERRGVTVLMRVTARETLFGLERIREIGGMPFVLLRSQTIPRSRAQFKRLSDLTITLLLAPFWLPLLAVVALYQLAVAGRPLLYWQDRVGRWGRPFRLVKFRTMRVDAEADGRGARLAESDDPRIIPACRWIREMRLDELPQVWNVLRGEMSLVGPRPERPELTRAFAAAIPGYSRRHELPPGLTGLAQIHGRYHTDAEYKLGYDLQYLVNWSPILDLEILARTIWVVLARRV